MVDIIIGWRPSVELLHSAKNLSLFINPGAGVQHLIERFRELNKTRSVTLVNGHGNSYFTAQHAVALLLALTNKVIPHHNWMSDGQWRKGDRDAISIPLRHRKVGLLGYGAVNQKVHRFLSGFDVEFAVLRRKWGTLKESLPTHIEMFSLDQLHRFLNWIDTIIIAVPLTEMTKGLIGIEELKLLGSKGLLVHLGRGDVIDEGSLYIACRDRMISGAAIDVWYDYTPSPNDTGLKYPYHFPFHTLENVVLSPHRAASPFNDLERWDEVIDNIERFVTGRKQYRNVVVLENEY
ncbi:MAG: NAD(P)-dependent oxidoreductase [Candidatus Electryoneaceae bacterium]|nr:NAD(P)-dependent oxidoreductase [Candidatus Electryoneaceae bacterium]